MDMYQKRKMRQEKVKNGNKEENSKYNINWYKPTYGKLLYETINKEVVMKKIEDRYTNNIFENIKHIDEQGNEYWYARELSKVLEYKDWRNFLKVLNKAKDVHYEVGKKVRKAIADIGGMMPEEMPTH